MTDHSNLYLSNMTGERPLKKTISTTVVSSSNLEKHSFKINTRHLTEQKPKVIANEAKQKKVLLNFSEVC